MINRVVGILRREGLAQAQSAALATSVERPFRVRIVEIGTNQVKEPKGRSTRGDSKQPFRVHRVSLQGQFSGLIFGFLKAKNQLIPHYRGNILKRSEPKRARLFHEAAFRSRGLARSFHGRVSPAVACCLTQTHGDGHRLPT